MRELPQFQYSHNSVSVNVHCSYNINWNFGIRWVCMCLQLIHMNPQYQLRLMFEQYRVWKYGAFVMQEICRNYQQHRCVETISNILIKSVGHSWSLEQRVPTAPCSSTELDLHGMYVFMRHSLFSAMAATCSSTTQYGDAGPNLR